MKVQCSILESQLRGLTESPLKALNGNQDRPELIQFRHSFCAKKICGMPRFDAPSFYGYGYYQNGGNPIPSTSQTVKRLWDLYSTRVDHWVSTLISAPGSFTGTSSVANPGERPQSAGYQGRAFNDAQPEGTSVDPPSVLIDGATGAHWDRNYGAAGTQHFDSALSGLIDVAGKFTNAKERFMALVFGDWSMPMYQLTWIDVGGGFHPNVDAYSASIYNGSESLTTTPDAGGASSQFPCISGWEVHGAGLIRMWRGQVRYQGSEPKPYWIGRQQYNHYADSGELLERRTLVETGTLTPVNGEVIMEVAFPGGQALPPGQFTQDFYFIVVDQAVGGLGDTYRP